MDNQKKYKIAYKLTTVASTGLAFIEDSLQGIMGNATDTAFLRSFYILLSYDFELILKSRVVMTESFSKDEDIVERLKKLGHNIIKIKTDLGVTNLNMLGIKEIVESDDQYKITTTDDKEIQIEDFTKIRYDFLDGKTHTVDNNEHERIKGYTDTLFCILRKAKNGNEEMRA